MLTRYLSLLLAIAVTATASAGDEMDRAVETAARNFRIQTYENFRTNRPEYDQRIEVANEALRRFRLAADDVGRVEMQQWFSQAHSAQNSGLPTIPEIALEVSPQRRDRNRGFGGRAKIARPSNNAERRSGFVVTDYGSNPRFENHRRLNAEKNQQQESLASSDGNDSAITKALKNPGELFGKIGKSFLRGKSDDDDKAAAADPPADPPAEAPAELDNVSDVDAMANHDEDEMRSALDEIVYTDGEPNEFDALNSRIVGQNLAIGILMEDFQGDDVESVGFLSQYVDRLESLNSEHFAIDEQRSLLSGDQQNELTAVISLEEISGELMEAVNEMEKQLNAGEIEDENGTLQTTLGDLRMRLSAILAEQPL